MKQLSPKIKSWWLSLSKREQNLMAILAIALGIFVIYFGMVQPAISSVESARSRAASERALLTWVENQANQIVSLRRSSDQISADNSIPFNQMINNSSQQYGLKLIRVQPRDDSYQVWFEPTSFNQFVDFIDYLQSQYGIRIEALELSRGNQPGLVEIKRLQMTSGRLQ
ncbi:type II secretion system protein M [Vibrio sp.]|uniref:Type II secretion system protein M n=1 Tax=Vibrio viridaestus TaxID=2487322 RepID=A0A3N9TB72_9VIBR|nr:type II secretion system protein M [Vibrio viridaestus]MDC0610015.1 type II secretion system protein M [Vibrio sp.]RQW61387.1 type II secretion system protein M [Vibrio viridaestus]